MYNLDVVDFRSFEVDQRYKSKQNTVYSVRNKSCDYVVKEYRTTEGKSKEVFYLKLFISNGLSVPSIVYEGQDYIVMEKLPNNTLLDEVTRYEEQGLSAGHDLVKNIFRKVIDWLQDFYVILRNSIGKDMIFADTNFRNFIYTDKIYGFDFEDIQEGRREQDFGRLCAHLIRYTPENTNWKRDVCNLVFDMLEQEYGYDRHILVNEFDRQLKLIDYRRHLKDSSRLENPNTF